MTTLPSKPMPSKPSIPPPPPPSSSADEWSCDVFPSIPSSSSFAPPPPHGWSYDVFLSFKGEDTRLNFVDHLSDAFHEKGIVSFRDDKDIEKGNTIASELIKAIQESRISLVILSPKYASSAWCLNELLKILQCRNEKGQVVLPIFYQVQPSEVWNKNGRFLKAVAEHDQRVPWQKVEMWKDALAELAGIAGWVTRDRHEASIIKDVVKVVLKRLRYLSPDVAMDSSLHPDDISPASLNLSSSDITVLPLEKKSESNCISPPSTQVRELSSLGIQSFPRSRM